MRRSEYRVYYPIILHGDSHQNHRYRRQDKDGEEKMEFTNLSSPWKIEEEQADKGDRPYEAKRVKVKHSILWNPYAVIIEIICVKKKLNTGRKSSQTQYIIACMNSGQRSTSKITTKAFLFFFITSHPFKFLEADKWQCFCVTIIF